MTVDPWETSQEINHHRWPRVLTVCLTGLLALGVFCDPVAAASDPAMDDAVQMAAGRQAMESGLHAESAAIFQTLAADKRSPVRYHARHLEARARIAMVQAAETVSDKDRDAITELLHSLVTTRDYPMGDDALRDLLRFLRDRDQWSALLKFAPDPTHDTEYRLLTAEAYHRTGQRDRAETILRDLWIHETETAFAAAVEMAYRRTLADAGKEYPAVSTAQLFEHARSLDRGGRREEAIDIYRKILASKPAPSRQALVRIYLGKVLSDIRQNEEALAVYDAFIAEHPGHASIPTAYFRKSIIYRRLNDDEAYLDMIRRIETRHGASKWWPWVLLGRGDYWRSRGEWNRADTDYQTVIQKNRGSRDTATWRRAWLAYDAGQPLIAAERLDAMARRYRGTGWDLPVDYWRIRFRELAASMTPEPATPDRAQMDPGDYRRLVREHPWKYYGQLAAARVGQTQECSSDMTVPDLMPSEKILREIHAAEVLSTAGYPGRASAEWAAAEQRITKPGEGFVLRRAEALMSAGDVPEARRRVLNYYDTRVSKGDFPGIAARLIYPYPDTLKPFYESAASRAGIDPLLAAAVTLQESGFDRRALSHNLAGGLMQVMPELFQRFAETWDASPDADQYSEPKYNIRAGTEYLAWLLDTFDGSLAKALAGYNAGEHRVREWNRAYPYPDEIWIEHIPFTQTRMFVKHVIENYNNYRCIYDTSGSDAQQHSR